MYGKLVIRPTSEIVVTLQQHGNDIHIVATGEGNEELLLAVLAKEKYGSKFILVNEGCEEVVNEKAQVKEE